MVADAVRDDRLTAGRVVRACAGDHSSPGCARFGVDDHILLHEPRLEQGSACQDDGRGVAAGVGDQVGVADLVAEELGQPVDGILQVLRVRVGVPIPLLVDRDIVEPVVTGKVDGLDPLLQERRDLVHRDTMGGRHEHQVEVLRVGDPLGELYVHVPLQEGVDIGDPRTRVLAGGHGCDLDVRMRAEEACQLAAGIPGASDDPYSGHGYHLIMVYTHWRSIEKAIVRFRT